MALERKDRVQDTTATTGTGAFTLDGATIAGFRTFGSAHTVGATLEYFASLGSDWEVGLGTLTDSTHLVRTTVLSSSNGGSLVNFGAGSKTIFETVSGAAIARMLTANDVPFSQSVPLSIPGSSYMTPAAVSGPLTFTPAASAVRGALVYLRLTADGTNTPNFAAFKEWGGSSGYDNRNGIVNQVQFFYDGVDSWFSASQAVGAVPLPAAATAVTLTGPTSGVVSTASSAFTAGVSPVGGTITGTVVVTPSDGGAGGTFSPATVSLTSANPTGTFTYTPSSTGARTISVTNSGGLSNPAGITYTAAASATVPAAPTIGTAVAGDGYIDVYFTRNSNGGAAVIDSTATLSTGQTATGTTSPLRVTATNGTAATATVKDRNSVGSSAASAASNSVTPAAAAPAGQFLRLTTALDHIQETGSGPYTYALVNGANTFNSQGGVSTQVRPTGTDAWTTVINNASPTICELIFGVTNAANAAFGSMDYAIWTGSGASSNYTPITGGAIGSATAVPKAAGDTIKLAFIGTTLVVTVARAADPTTWVPVYTFSGVSTASRKFAVNAASGTSFQTGSSVGLA